MLYNLTKHKAYIGKTMNFHSRAVQHKNHLLCNTHPSKSMQSDFNNGDEFCFVILEDMGICDKEDVLKREKQYIFAFRDKYIKIYNHETIEQLKHGLFFDMVCPTIDRIRSDFQKNFGCPMASLERCSTNTLKEKFNT